MATYELKTKQWYNIRQLFRKGEGTWGLLYLQNQLIGGPGKAFFAYQDTKPVSIKEIEGILEAPYLSYFTIYDPAVKNLWIKPAGLVNLLISIGPADNLNVQGIF